MMCVYIYIYIYIYADQDKKERTQVVNQVAMPTKQQHMCILYIANEHVYT